MTIIKQISRCCYYQNSGKKTIMSLSSVNYASNSSAAEAMNNWISKFENDGKSDVVIRESGAEYASFSVLKNGSFFKDVEFIVIAKDVNPNGYNINVVQSEEIEF